MTRPIPMGNWLVVGKDISNLQYDKKILKVFIRCLGGFFLLGILFFSRRHFSLYCKADARCVFSVSGSRSEVPARGLSLPGKTVLTLEKTKVLTEFSVSTFVFSVPRFVCSAHSGVMGRRGMCAGGGGCAGLFPLPGCVRRRVEVSCRRMGCSSASAAGAHRAGA